MKAQENVELVGGRSDILMQRFAAAIRGDYQVKWEESNDEEKRNWIISFNNDIELHAKNAFDVGVQYGLAKAKQQA